MAPASPPARAAEEELVAADGGVEAQLALALERLQTMQMAVQQLREAPSAEAPEPASRTA